MENDMAGGEVVFRGLNYPQVTGYTPLDAGEYRTQFLPSGQMSPALAETTIRVDETLSST